MRHLSTKLLRDGELYKTTTTDTSKEWNYTFENIPTCDKDSNEYEYRVEEVPVENYITEYEDFNIIISSMRLDNFVSELTKCSRTKANEIIEMGRVFVNSINEFKFSKKIELNDIITIRGKGKFIFEGIEKETKSGKLLVNIKKYK